MRHDQFWKTTLWIFFREFMELFFPEVSGHLDFTRIKLLDKEMFTDLPSGELREPDLVVEIYTLDGDLEIILVHIEVQTRRESDVPYRMWEYYSLLRLRTRNRVFPLVVYLEPGIGGVVQESYVETLFEREIQSFKYMAVGLRDLPAEEFLENENVLAPALSALMRGEEGTRVIRKLRAYGRMCRSDLDDARKSQLLHMIDRYLPLSEDEEVEMSQKMKEKEQFEVHEWLSEYEMRGIRKGIGQGIEQGIEQGLLQGTRKTLMLLLEHKFGLVPEELARRIEEIDNVSELDALALKAMDATALSDLDMD